MRARLSWSILLVAAVALGRPASGYGQPPAEPPAERPEPDQRPDQRPGQRIEEGADEGAPQPEADAQEEEGEGQVEGEGEGEMEPPPAEPTAPPEGQPPLPAGGVEPQVAPEAEPAGADTAEAEPAPVPPSRSAPPALPPASEPPPDVPSPDDLEQRLAQEVPQDFSGVDTWTAPVPVLTLHGYMRMRGELMDTFWLGRRQLASFLADPNVDPAIRLAQGPDPFSRFRPLEASVNPGTGMAPEGLDCVDEDRAPNGTCEVDTLQFANVRLRLSPQLNLTEDVRVKATFDIFDNFVAGTAPRTFYGTPSPNRLVVEDTVFARTDIPESLTLGDSIKARRAWAEVRNRTLGELRFGRMPLHWGLGMHYNAGNGLDDDLSTDFDRVLGITKIEGIYLSASYDFIAEGFLRPNVAGRAIDGSQLDDVDQFTFTAAIRHTPEELASDLERGQLVLNAGALFSIRNQDSVYSFTQDPAESDLERVESTYYTTDLWGLLRFRNLRVEAEVAWVTGGMDDFLEDSGELDISQLGYAIETELRLIDDHLGLYLYHGLASGDQDVEGLSSEADLVTQLGSHDSTISTFRFHPSYRIDLIMWRNLMRQVTGAWYVRPGISYDFLRGDFGQLFGARLDVTYSRATAFIQTWGNDPDLGLEVNASLYWRSEDGAELEDGYHAQLQYGVLFPMRGLGYYHEDTDLDTAQTLRLLLGVVF